MDSASISTGYNLMEYVALMILGLITGLFGGLLGIGGTVCSCQAVVGPVKSVEYQVGRSLGIAYVTGIMGKIC